MSQVDHRGFVAAGDVFVVVWECAGGMYFKIGDIVEVCRDDGSNSPEYQNVLTGVKYYYYTEGVQKLEQIEVGSAVQLPEGTEVIFLGYVPGNNGSCHDHWCFWIGDRFVADADGCIVNVRSGKRVSWNWGFKFAILPTDADQQETENVEEVADMQAEAPATVTAEQKRDRINAISALITELQAEEVELRAQLRAAGFQLLQPEEASIPDGVSRTDYRTWKAGDIVVCVKPSLTTAANLTEGREYSITKTDSDGDGYIRDDDGDEMYGCVRRGCFEFVRRP